MQILLVGVYEHTLLCLPSVRTDLSRHCLPAEQELSDSLAHAQQMMLDGPEVAAVLLVPVAVLPPAA